MATFDVDSVSDLLNTTLEGFEKGKITDLTLDDQRHYFLPQIMREERVDYQSGKSIIFDAVTDNTPARHHGLHDKDQILIQDVIAQGTVPWRFTTNNWAVDVHEIAMNRDPSMITSLVEARRLQMWSGLSNTIETCGWSKPASSTDVTTPWGIKMYITKKITGSSAATSTGEFGGGNPSGYTSGAAGISSTTEPRWANWTQAYVNVSDNDLVDKMRTAQYHIMFYSPAAGKYTDETKGPDKYGIYMGYPELRDLEKIAESKNENLGQDLAPYDGQITFRKHKMYAVPKLDDDSDNPVYFINWAVMYPVGMGGKFLNESAVKPVPGMRNDVAQHVQMMWNLVCKNRRRQAVLVTAADND